MWDINYASISVAQPGDLTVLKKARGSVYV